MLQPNALALLGLALGKIQQGGLHSQGRRIHSNLGIYPRRHEMSSIAQVNQAELMATQLFIDGSRFLKGLAFI
jgi:hypothetical protein